MAETININRDDGRSIDQSERDRLPDWQSVNGSSGNTRRSGLDWRVWLAIVGSLFVLVAYLLVRFTQYLADVSYETSWLDVWLIAAFKMALFLGPAALMCVLVYWLYQKASAARLVRLQNNMPIARRHIEANAWQPEAVGSLQAFYGVQTVWAANSGLRSLNQLDLSSSKPQGKEPATIAAPALIDTGPDVTAIPSATWLAWFDRVPHVMLAAETGGGKTTTALHILAPRLQAAEHCYIIDPNASGWGGIPSVGGGEDWEAVAGAMSAVIRLYGERQQERAEALRLDRRELAHDYFPRLTVILDEAYMTKQALDTGKDSIWRKFVPILGSGARKVGISVILLTQTANVEDIGLSAPLRENYTRLALDSGAARKFILAEEADRKRREALLAALAGVAFPAVAERNGQIVILDRSDLDRTPPLPADVDRLAWRPVLAPSQRRTLRQAIKDYQRRNIGREQARADGLQFDNGLWSEVASEGV